MTAGLVQASTTPELAAPAPIPPDPFPNPSTPYGKAVCRGNRLLLGMTLSRELAGNHVTPLDSQWVGELRTEMDKWAYKDESDHPDLDVDCDVYSPQAGYFVRGIRILADISQVMGQWWFKQMLQYVFPKSQACVLPSSKVYHHLQYTKFGISKAEDDEETHARKQNIYWYCYSFQDIANWLQNAVIWDPNGDYPSVSDQKYKVDGKEYRVTDAKFAMGVNAKDGVLYFLHRVSPQSTAQKLWGRVPSSDELPTLRASSDIAWSFWNCHMDQDKKPIKDITKIFSMSVTNVETMGIIRKALSEWEPLPGQHKVVTPRPFLGTTFDTSGIPGAALLGSPNGVGAGFCIAQHRLQLENKWILKITVFSDDDSFFPTMPNLLFWVKDLPLEEKKPPPESEKGEKRRIAPGLLTNVTETRVSKRGIDGKSIVREHIYRAKL
ncbi:hypothetical protein EK21DRAFT_114017 [Setomelanomma holmii]|uniref:Uncharacterized protein n=1 Tax=Setomelanomma holmii TaxID=210430 RepID=A0A9P4H4W1_9PLEO|nr:hypothetical protein EK21DRAFT_114017 [Setomelanomma holmii]